MAIVERNTHIQPRYKQTEVGVIPEDWHVKQIRDVCSLINGRGFKPHEWQTIGLPIIRIQNLNGSEDFNYYSGPYSPKILIEHEQLLFAWSGSRGTSFGPHVWNGGRALLNYHTWKVVINESRVNPHFLLHALRQLTGYIETKAHGASALVHVQKWEMEKFLVPIPSSLPEQRVIATALSDVEALITSLDKLIAKKRDIKQATMQQLLTGKTRLPGFSGEQRPSCKQTEVGEIPEDWVVKTLGEIVNKERPICYGIVQAGKSVANGVSCIRVIDLDNGKINKENLITTSKDISNSYKRTILKEGDLVIALRGKIGELALIDKELVGSNLTRGVALIAINDSLASSFFLYQLSSSASKVIFEKNLNGSALQEIPIGVLRKIPVAYPSHKSEQTAIATILSDMDAEIAALEQKRDKTRALKQGMMQELLTGKTRLVTP